MTIRDFKKFILAILLLITLNCAAADVYVLHHKTLSDPINQEQLQKFLTSEILQWSKGENITLMINDIQQIDSADFIKVTTKTKSDFLQTWRAKYFSGRAFIPTEVKSLDVVYERIISNPNSIYVSIVKKVDSSHKDIKLIKLSF